jgi:hypothetical protein
VLFSMDMLLSDGLSRLLSDGMVPYDFREHHGGPMDHPSFGADERTGR